MSRPKYLGVESPRETAIRLGQKTYQAMIACVVCGGVERTVAGYHCTVCKKIKDAARYTDSTKLQKHKIYQKQWRISNADSEAVRRKKWSIDNPEKELANKRANENKRRVRKLKVVSDQINDSKIKELFAEQWGTCYWCFAPLTDYHLDHITPISRGGTDLISNLCLACVKCNLQKHNKLPIEWYFTSGCRAIRSFETIKRAYLLNT